MVILDTSFSCIKYLLKTIVGFYFLQVIKIPINHQSYYLVYFVMQAVTFRFFIYLLSNI